ncbi:MAG: hypothetical protein HC877_23515 [Thioploca sp.]|nr:hypothetical protein [Thioploca sp.]
MDNYKENNEEECHEEVVVELKPLPVGLDRATSARIIYHNALQLMLSGQSPDQVINNLNALISEAGYEASFVPGMGMLGMMVTEPGESRESANRFRQLVQSSPELAKPALLPAKEQSIHSDGMNCAKCEEYFPMAEPNVGTNFVCYSCRNPLN